MYEASSCFEHTWQRGGFSTRLRYMLAWEYTRRCMHTVPESDKGLHLLVAFHLSESNKGSPFACSFSFASHSYYKDSPVGLARTVHTVHWCVCTVYDRIFGDFPAKNTGHAHIYMVLANPTHLLVRAVCLC